MLAMLGGALIKQSLDKRSLQRKVHERDTWLRLTEESNAKLHGANQELQHQATHDELTGLLNKKAWKQKIEDRIDRGKSFGIIFMDLNAFKKINDDPRFGHEFGDSLLANFGLHLQEAFRREDDSVTREAGRYGGDEFGLLFDLEETTGDRADVADLQALRTIDHLRQSINEFVEEQEPVVRATGFGVAMGLAVWTPESNLTAGELLQSADREMYEDKRNQGGGR